MRFGVCIEAPVEWPELLALAREIDRNSGYDFFWISDSLAANPPHAPKLDAWIALAAVAQATKRLRLGVLVSGNVYRHPSLLAKMATSVDHISGGRLELGIGAGWPGENVPYGIPFGTRRERRERLAEALEVLKLLWTRDRPEFAGKHYRLDAPHFSPMPVQRPHPPIHVGGGHDELLRLTARYGDALNPMIDVRQAFDKVDRYARDAGRGPATIPRTLEVQMFLHDDPDVQRRAIEWASKTYGQSEEEVRRTSLFGSLDDVRAGVQRFADTGVQELYVFQLPAIHAKSLLRFSEEVIPHFQ